MPPTPEAPPPDVSLSCDIMFSSSMPVVAFFNFSADFVALSSPAAAFSASSPNSISNDILSGRFISIPISEAIVFSTSLSAITIPFTYGKTLRNVPMKKLPKTVFNSINCSFSIRSWFAGWFIVLAQSPNVFVFAICLCKAITISNRFSI